MMLNPSYANVNVAVYNLLDGLMVGGNDVTVRGLKTRELMHASFTIFKPLQRCTLLEGRDGNVFAQIAETLWMLSGRNDLDWLEMYIPQCKKWSDDGSHWRAAYGPRLRNWEAASLSGIPGWYRIDQIAEVVKKLQKDPQTRQAVISIWDPAQDWVEGSRDYPCNNWLHFMIRNGELHLNVAVRSNDLIYGFSHIDFFSWSVLLQLMAHWVGVDVGNITWNASSLHIYDTHYKKAQLILDSNPNAHRYPPVITEVGAQFRTFDAVVEGIMIKEAAMRVASTPVSALYQLELHGSTLLDVFEYLMLVYVFYKKFVLPEHNEHLYNVLLTRIESDLPNCDLKQAAVSYIKRTFVS